MTAAVSPFTAENGYELAPSYESGKVVDSYGGGICQVSTTLYNALLKSELEILERHNHTMIVTYVDPSKDAAIAEGLMDLQFANNTDYPIYIEGYGYGGGTDIYGIRKRVPLTGPHCRIRQRDHKHHRAGRCEALSKGGRGRGLSQPDSELPHRSGSAAVENCDGEWRDHQDPGEQQYLPGSARILRGGDQFQRPQCGGTDTDRHRKQ